MLEGLCTSSQAPLLLLLGRKNCFLILQSPLHYELILERAERPEGGEATQSSFTNGCEISSILQTSTCCSGFSDQQVAEIFSLSLSLSVWVDGGHPLASARNFTQHYEASILLWLS